MNPSRRHSESRGVSWGWWKKMGTEKKWITVTPEANRRQLQQQLGPEGQQQNRHKEGGAQPPRVQQRQLAHSQRQQQRRPQRGQQRGPPSAPGGREATTGARAGQTRRTAAPPAPGLEAAAASEGEACGAGAPCAAAAEPGAEDAGAAKRIKRLTAFLDASP